MKIKCATIQSFFFSEVTFYRIHTLVQISTMVFQNLKIDYFSIPYGFLNKNFKKHCAIAVQCAVCMCAQCACACSAPVIVQNDLNIAKKHNWNH